MKRWLLLALLAAAGCDDPAASDLAASVLLHGATKAHAECTLAGTAFGSATGLGSSQLRLSLLQDGACLAGIAGDTVAPFQPWHVSGTGFTPRGDAHPCSQLYPYPSPTLYVSAGDVVDGAGYSYDIATNCSGFGLSAFGELP